MLSLLSRNSVRSFRASSLRACAPLAKRLSSTQSTDSKTETAADDKSMSFTEKMKATWDQSHSRIKQIGIYTGIGAVGFGVLTGVVDIMEYVGSMSFITVGEFAFEAGLVTAGLVASAFLYVRSHFFIMDPRKILDMCLKRVIQDSTCQSVFGPDVHMGRFEAFGYQKKPVSELKHVASALKTGVQSGVHAVKGAHAAFMNTEPTDDKAAEEAELKRSWLVKLTDWLYEHKSMQLMFEVRGTFGKGFVSADLYLEGGMPRYRSLTVTHCKTGKRLVLEGEVLPPFRVLLNNQELLNAIVMAEQIPATMAPKAQSNAPSYTHLKQ